jgi:hypothetical protein
VARTSFYVFQYGSHLFNLLLTAVLCIFAEFDLFNLLLTDVLCIFAEFDAHGNCSRWKNCCICGGETETKWCVRVSTLN